MPAAHKVVQLLAEHKTERGFACEFFTPETEQGVEALRPRVDRLAATEPLFMDFVGYGGEEAAMRALHLARHAKRTNGVPAVLHLTCADMSRAATQRVLDEAKRLGIVNVVAERGVPLATTPSAAPPDPGERPAFAAAEGGFSHAHELVAFIRAGYGNRFCVGVMGFPAGRGEYASAAEDLAAMRRKQDAGADFILAQHVLEIKHLQQFVADCLASGVELPIIPCLLPVQDYDTFIQINAYCGVPIPAPLRVELERLRGDVAAVRALGNRALVLLGEEIYNVGIPVVLLHTLNLETVVRDVLGELGLSGPQAAKRRKLPWRPSGDESRAGEDVRPIFWANRPTSYVDRTSDWIEFPSGRWRLKTDDALASSAGTGRVFQLPAELVTEPETTAEERRAMWGEAPTEPAHVWDIFARYVERRGVPRLPWCESDLLPETGTITRELARLNGAGFLTINSQPRLNAVPSGDAIFGWGGPGGYIYQKAYIECFCSPGHLAALFEACARYPSVTYHAIDAKNNAYSTSSTQGVQAVTWGVFPGREIVQPTVVDAECFLQWKEEAFHLWSHWTSAYSEDSVSRELLEEIQDTYFLVNIVDNDFVHGDLFSSVFDVAIAKLQAGEAQEGGGAR